MKNLIHLHINYGTNFTEAGFLSLFDMNDGIHQLRYLRFVLIAELNDNCVDAITKWLHLILLIMTFFWYKFSCPNIEAFGIFDCDITTRSFAMIIDRLRYRRSIIELNYFF